MGLHCETLTNACPYDVAGYTFSGLPGVVIGHNNDIGWGFTNLTADVSDLYLEKVTGDSFIVDGKKQPLSQRREVIRIAGAAPVAITVRSTDHGPILSDVSKDYRRAGAVAPTVGGNPAGVAYAVSLEWTALKPGHSVDAIRLIDGAHNWAQFRQAASLFDVPAQNLVYADVKGNIGYQTPGWIPTRTGWNGDWPAPGWLSKYGWTGRVPFAALPSVYNPKEGFIVTANNAVVVPQYPYAMGTDFDYGFRAQRIADLLTQAKKAGPITIGELQKIQVDTYNGNAAFLMPAMQKAGLLSGYDGKTQAAVDVMKRWNLRNESTSAGALVFNVFWSTLLAKSFDTQLPKDYRAAGDDRWYMTVRTLWNRPLDQWWDNSKTSVIESRNPTVRAAMKSAAAYVESKFGNDATSWEWGKLHQLNLKNATFGSSGIGAIEWLFNRGPYNVGGGPGIVDAIGWNASDGYGVDALPSMRQVLDPSAWDRSTWVQLTGESGHASNSWYVDQTPTWQSGQQLAWAYSRSAVEKAGKFTLTLQPS
jgi:penicillin amidase